MIKYVKINKSKDTFLKSIEIKNNKAIKYIAQSGTSGYATAAKGYLANYVLNGTPIKWQKLIFDDSKDDYSYYVDALSECAYYSNFESYETLIIHSTPDIWNDYLQQNTNIENKIGYCTWETNKLPEKWVKEINLMPNVWVPSSFNKECFLNSGVTSNISVIPHIWHRRELINKSNIQIFDYCRNLVPNGKYTFYSIGELNFRKGIEDLVSVFDKLSDVNENIQLVLKIHYKGYSENHKKYCIETLNKLTNKIGKSIYLLLDNLSNRDVIALHSFGDCYVSLNKGEGFGLTIFDAFNLGKRVIATGYGGQIDYLGKTYEGLVDFKLNKVKGMEKFSSNYSEDQEWAYPDLDHAYSLMKKFYEN